MLDAFIYLRHSGYRNAVIGIVQLGAGLLLRHASAALRRTAAGGFTLRQAVTMQQILDFAAENDPQALLMPVDALFSRHPALIVTILEKILDDGERAALRPAEHEKIPVLRF